VTAFSFRRRSRLFEIACLFLRLDHVAGRTIAMENASLCVPMKS